MLEENLKMNQPAFLKLIDDYLLFRLNYAAKDTTNKYILEGVQFCFVENSYKEFAKYPILIMGTGAIKASIRAALRNYKMDKEMNNKPGFKHENIFIHMQSNFKNNFKNIDKYLNSLKKYLKN